jgi:hypothetical protein
MQDNADHRFGVKGVETTEPEIAIAVTRKLLERPDLSEFEIATELECPRPLVARIARRIERSAPGRNIRSVAASGILELVEDRTYQALSEITDEKLIDSTAKDAAEVFAKLNNAGQLLRGEATSIVGFKHMRELEDTGQSLLAEMRKRGLVEDAVIIEEKETNMNMETE